MGLRVLVDISEKTNMISTNFSGLLPSLLIFLHVGELSRSKLIVLATLKQRESKHFLSFLNKACQSDFEQTHTLYGNCYRFHPKETDQFLAPFGRQAGLSLILSFNESDWTSGWNHLLKGWGYPVISMQRTHRRLALLNIFR